MVVVHEVSLLEGWWWWWKPAS